MESILVFGYGSLMSKKSLMRTVSDPIEIFPARLEGFVRAFNFEASRVFDPVTKFPIGVLNLREKKGEFVNGVCIRVNRKDFEKLAEREKRYERYNLEVSHYNNPEEKYQAVVFIANGLSRTAYQFGSNEQKRYLYLMIDGSKEYGEDFERDIFQTTFIGENRLVNIKDKVL